MKSIIKRGEQVRNNVTEKDEKVWQETGSGGGGGGRLW
jgi:hypothetical protein